AMGTAAPQRTLAEQAGTEHTEKTGQPDATQRRPAHQPGIRVGVALVQPGEAGEKPAAKEFLGYPERGETATGQPAVLPGAQPAGPDPGGCRRNERQAGDQAASQQRRQRWRRIAVHMDADIDPGYSTEKQPQPPAPAAPQRLASIQFPHALVQQG